MSTTILVDLNRCGSYGQCVFAAPTLFRLVQENILEWRYEADDVDLEAALQAKYACPVSAITVAAAPSGAR